ncbi:MAG: hypothetical protein RL095_1389 [Verrucomicrobiota bacterium]
MQPPLAAPLGLALLVLLSRPSAAAEAPENLFRIDNADLSLVKQGYGQPGAGKSVDGGPLSHHGQPIPHGLGTHAPASLYFDLKKSGIKFTAAVGIDDSAGNRASVEFLVKGDRKILWRSGLMRKSDPLKKLSVELGGVQNLELLVSDGGDGMTDDHAVWADAVIEHQGKEPAAMPPPPLPDRWVLGSGVSTEWRIGADAHLPHNDFIEQGGRRVAQKVWYAVDADGLLTIERDLVWPSLRIFPNDTHGSLVKHYKAADAEPVITVDGKPLGRMKVDRVLLDGTLTFIGRAGGLRLKRVTYPSLTKAAALDTWTLENASGKAVRLEIAPLALSASTEGPYGASLSEVSHDAPSNPVLAPGKSLSFSVRFAGRGASDAAPAIDPKEEEKSRRDFISGLNRKLRLKTPDAAINTAFDFAKWRAAESINDTRGGMMLAPGNLRYYAAMWCNDNVEYAGPFFPFLGDEGGNEASLNSYRHFQRFMKPDFQPIPSSIVAEGVDIWNGAGDRGDAAMYAYGAARFVLARGDRAIAEELWPAILWSLEYCRRKKNPDGVISSRCDELEGRLPAGQANLSTSSLYYGALRSAADIAACLGKDGDVRSFNAEAETIAAAIERHFGAKVEGFDTYRYYDGNKTLRSWICFPLSMGIDTRKNGTIEALFSPRLWTIDGLASESGGRIFWDRSTLYAFRAVFQAGEGAKAMDFFKSYTHRRLLGEHVPYAVEAYPEGGQAHLSSESALYCRILVEGVFGILPSGLDRLQCKPQLPEAWPRMALQSVRSSGRDYDVEVERRGDRLSLRISCDGRSSQILIRPGQTVEVSFPSEPQAPRLKLLPDTAKKLASLEH